MLPDENVQVFDQITSALLRRAEAARRKAVRLSHVSISASRHMVEVAECRLADAQRLYLQRKTEKRKMEVDLAAEDLSKREQILGVAKERYEAASRRAAIPSTVAEFLRLIVLNLVSDVEGEEYEEEMFEKENGAKSIPGYLSPITANEV